MSFDFFFDTCSDCCSRALTPEALLRAHSIAISARRSVDGIVNHCGYGKAGIPRLSLIVIKNHQILTERSYGLADLATEKANASFTNYRIGSVSKQFTAIVTDSGAR